MNMLHETNASLGESYETCQDYFTLKYTNLNDILLKL